MLRGIVAVAVALASSVNYLFVGSSLIDNKLLGGMWFQSVN